MTIPHGYQALLATYGDPAKYRGTDGHLTSKWDLMNFVTVPLPAPLPYAYDSAKAVTRIRCHRLVATDLELILAEINTAGLWHALGSFGGCYADRSQRGNAAKPSTHTWGIALDFNPAVLVRGHTATQPDVLAAFGHFEAHGWAWGQHFAVPDPMHVQAATGY